MIIKTSHILSIIILNFFVISSPKTLIGFEHYAANIPFPQKKDKGGEDAWYKNDYLLSVADGVGGWNNQGVDPAKYSRKLEVNVRDYFARNEHKYRRYPKLLMKIAADNNRETGSSTFIIVTIDPTLPILRTSLLGDSTYLIIRQKGNGEWYTVFRSQEQQHSFNFPFQCGTNGDPISSAVENQHDIEVNDIVVVATDGVFDNLYNQDVLDLMNSKQYSDLQMFTNDISELAFKKSLDTNYDSPFSIGARSHGYDAKGGKSDDITVVVGKIKEAILE